jgi:hypothetical protein
MQITIAPGWVPDASCVLSVVTAARDPATDARSHCSGLPNISILSAFPRVCHAPSGIHRRDMHSRAQLCIQRTSCDRTCRVDPITDIHRRIPSRMKLLPCTCFCFPLPAACLRSSWALSSAITSTSSCTSSPSTLQYFQKMNISLSFQHEPNYARTHRAILYLAVPPPAPTMPPLESTARVPAPLQATSCRPRRPRSRASIRRRLATQCGAGVWNGGEETLANMGGESAMGWWLVRSVSIYFSVLFPLIVFAPPPPPPVCV